MCLVSLSQPHSPHRTTLELDFWCRRQRQCRSLCSWALIVQIIRGRSDCMQDCASSPGPQRQFRYQHMVHMHHHDRAFEQHRRLPFANPRETLSMSSCHLQHCSQRTLLPRHGCVPNLCAAHGDRAAGRNVGKSLAPGGTHSKGKIAKTGLSAL